MPPLAYCCDHKAEMDAESQCGVREVERPRTQAGESPLRKRLGEMG